MQRACAIPPPLRLFLKVNAVPGADRSKVSWQTHRSTLNRGDSRSKKYACPFDCGTESKTGHSHFGWPKKLRNACPIAKHVTSMEQVTIRCRFGTCMKFLRI